MCYPTTCSIVCSWTVSVDVVLWGKWWTYIRMICKKLTRRGTGADSQHSSTPSLLLKYLIITVVLWPAVLILVGQVIISTSGLIENEYIIHNLSSTYLLMAFYTQTEREREQLRHLWTSIHIIEIVMMISISVSFLEARQKGANFSEAILAKCSNSLKFWCSPNFSLRCHKKATDSSFKTQVGV